VLVAEAAFSAQQEALFTLLSTDGLAAPERLRSM
jgi:hypothetical protein